MGALRAARALSAALFGVLLLGLAGCGRIPASRYGVESVEIKGVGALDEEALKACLVTSARARARIELGVHPDPECGKPPFDAWRKKWPLWTWGFADWPLFDRMAFERDRQRIERWYQARGYHHARVVGSSVEPAQALTSDTLDATVQKPGCERVASGQGCAVQAHFEVEEGEATRITDLEVTGLDALDEKVRREVLALPELAEGKRFDEALYQAAKERIAAQLQEHGYARVAVEGEVRVDRNAHNARLQIRVFPGPLCVFGQVRVEGVPSYMVGIVRAVTLIDAGDRYSVETLKSAKRAVFSAGGTSSVTIEPVLPASGNVVDVLVRVEPARKHRYGVGVGVQAGIVTRGDTWDPVSVPQWDVHLIAKYTQHRVLDGPRRLTIEDHPAMIIQEPFPAITEPRFGNDVRVELGQLGVFEPRVVMNITAGYVWGPDPYDTFFRHRIDTGLAFERLFLRNERLYVSTGVRNSIYRVPDDEETSEGEAPPASSVLTSFFQRVRLDYRDDVTRPRSGLMAQVEVIEFGIPKISSWRGFRTTPDLRVYIPLPLHASLAMRFAVGMLFIHWADSKLDELSEKLGPRDGRLRGGGATSNRGWLPGELGDGPDGGTRRWESSAELRLRLTVNFGAVGFFDAGDVSKATEFRWNHPQASSGFGLRYHTLVGPIRLDFAWRLKKLQVIGTDERDPGGEQNKVDFGFAKMAGAIHVTIGESF